MCYDPILIVLSAQLPKCVLFIINSYICRISDTYHSQTNLTITSNETATLYCGAKGSAISITWSCSGSVNCSDILEERDNSTMINSTLKVQIYDDASRLIDINCTITITDPMMKAMNTKKVLFTLEVLTCKFPVIVIYVDFVLQAFIGVSECVKLDMYVVTKHYLMGGKRRKHQ